jgi:hypothetical protein
MLGRNWVTCLSCTRDRLMRRALAKLRIGTLTLGTFVADSVDLDELVVSPIYGQDLASFQLK